MPAERARKSFHEPVPRIQPALFFASLVNFSIRARHQPFQIAADLRLAGEGFDLREVGRGALIQLVKLEQPRELHAPIGISLNAIERSFELRPMLAFLGEKPGEVNDHRSCRCLKSMYSDASWGPSVSASSSEKRTPW